MPQAPRGFGSTRYVLVWSCRQRVLVGWTDAVPLVASHASCAERSVIADSCQIVVKILRRIVTTMNALGLENWARETAEQLLSRLGDRWQHVLAVASLARRVAPSLDAAQSGTLTVAAYLHDIGYAPEIAMTGFHPLDGARFLRARGYEHVARLVAHHSGARHEAVLRGIDGYEDEFPFEDSALDQALTYCDLTTGPAGKRLSLADRVAEITERYGAEHVVARAINGATPEFERAVRDTEERMRAAGVDLSGSLAYPR